LKVKKLMLKLLAVAMLCGVSAGAFAQKDDKRPPKEPTKVITPDKQKDPPRRPAPEKPKNDKKGKP